MDVMYFGHGSSNRYCSGYLSHCPHRLTRWSYSLILFCISFSAYAVDLLPADPNDWICPSSEIEPTQQQIEDLCGQMPWDKQHPMPDFGKPVVLPAPPASLNDLDAKNRYDEALVTFINQRDYIKMGWKADKNWRMTGPYVGKIGEGKSFGVHPAVKIYYSPEVTEWLCKNREGELPDNAMIVKEMRSINDSLNIQLNDDGCMEIPDPDLPAESWAIMVKHNDFSHDGWYWAGFSDSVKDGKVEFIGNPPITDRTAATTATSADFFGPPPVKRNELWYPTGVLFEPLPQGTQMPNAVFPYNEFGNYCVNCHASAQSESTYSSLDNLLTPGLEYKGYNLDGLLKRLVPAAELRSIDNALLADKHAREAVALTALSAAKSSGYQTPFAAPLSNADSDFLKFYDQLSDITFGEALDLRLPAETFDHRFSGPDGPDQFLTSDQCIGCHDGTYSNSATPNMVIEAPDTKELVNLSPYGEWRASPMGLAGRDPIFFSQLQSETNHLPEMTQCIQNTCLHCHGVMGQRQQAIDTQSEGGETCEEIFAIPPPEGVPFGKPFALEQVTQWQDSPGVDSKYGALARDGISCAVCHHISDEDLGDEAGFTGNFVTGPADEVYGPFTDNTVVTKPMEHAIGIEPRHGKQIQDSALCGSCHNILLPIFNNDGTAHKFEHKNEVTGKTEVLAATYEQTTHLEWVNSDFAKPGTFQSCQDCHMGEKYTYTEDGKQKSIALEQENLAGKVEPFRIANIEDSSFAPTTHRLPDEEITLTPRPNYRRHQLHGLNVFLNEFFQQFPVILGVRQIDYMTGSGVTPPLITGRESMLQMADYETAEVTVQSFKQTADNQVSADVLVTNKVGHYLPSGVGFRRVFLEVIVKDKNGEMLWASGRTNKLGAILDGTSNNVLPSEQPVKNPDAPFQPHHLKITSGNQVQIYQELIKDSEGDLTTSFLRRIDHVKDNRLRPKGFDPKVFENNPSPYIQIVGELDGQAAKDKYYFNPEFTGADQIDYVMTMDPTTIERIDRVEVTLYSQAIPPFYLQERFRDANVSVDGHTPQKKEIQRLFYLTSHLNTAATANDGETYIENWKLKVANTCQTLNGPCGP